MKNKLNYLKILLVIIIFCWILKSININQTFSVLLKTNLIFFTLGLLLNNLSTFFLTFKWYRLSKPLVKLNYFELLKLNYIATFYSSFMPGQASGELIKGAKLSTKKGVNQKVWIPILIDKTTNVLIVFIIGLIAILIDDHYSKSKILIFLSFLATVSLYLITVILFSNHTNNFIHSIRDLLVKILEKIKINSNFIKNFSLSYLEEYKNHKFLMYETLIHSFFTKIPHIFSFYFLALSLNLNLNLVESAWLFSIVSISVLLPISFSGLGVREGVVVSSLYKIGIDSPSALSLSILIFLVGIITSLVGGIFELFSHNKHNEKLH